MVGAIAEYCKLIEPEKLKMTESSEGSKWGLVLQGPAMSSGRGGNGEWISDYNSIDNIGWIAKRFGYLFQEIIICAWEDEGSDLSMLERESKIRVVHVKDPGNPLLGTGKRLDNRLRMNRARQKGVEALDRQIDMVVVHRSDIEVDLEILIGQYIEYSRVRGKRDKQTAFKDLGALGVLYIHADKPYAVCDFGFYGERNVVQTWNDIQVERWSETFYRGWKFPEGDAIRKYLDWVVLELDLARYVHVNTPKSLLCADGQIQRLYYSELFRLWELALRYVFILAPSEAVSTLKWRGSTMSYGIGHIVCGEAQEEIARDYLRYVERKYGKAVRREGKMGTLE